MFKIKLYRVVVPDPPIRSLIQHRHIRTSAMERSISLGHQPAPMGPTIGVTALWFNIPLYGFPLQTSNSELNGTPSWIMLIRLINSKSQISTMKDRMCYSTEKNRRNRPQSKNWIKNLENNWVVLKDGHFLTIDCWLTQTGLIFTIHVMSNLAKCTYSSSSIN